MKYILGPALSLFSIVVSAQSGLVVARAEMSAAIARGDRLTYSRFLSDDITSIDSAGKLRNKTAAVEEMPSGNSQVKAESVDYGDGAIIAIGYSLAGESPARILQAWSRKEDQWQMVAFQGVRAVGNVTPATQRSSALPPSSGSEYDRAAIQRTLEEVRRAARSGEAQAWGGLVTDRFLATSPTGIFQRKADLMRDLDTAARRDEGLSITEMSVRIHGTLAVATMRIRGRASAEFWRTAILVKAKNGWRQAAEITTPITGAARAQ